MIMDPGRKFNFRLREITDQPASAGGIGKRPRHDDNHGQAGRGTGDYCDTLPEVPIGHVQDDLPLHHAEARLEPLR